MNRRTARDLRLELNRMDNWFCRFRGQFTIQYQDRAESLLRDSTNIPRHVDALGEELKRMLAESETIHERLDDLASEGQERQRRFNDREVTRSLN